MNSLLTNYFWNFEKDSNYLMLHLSTSRLPFDKQTDVWYCMLNYPLVKQEQKDD